MLRNDLRGYVLLGDPACRLPLSKPTRGAVKAPVGGGSWTPSEREGAPMSAEAAVLAVIRGDEPLPGQHTPQHRAQRIHVACRPVRARGVGEQGPSAAREARPAARASAPAADRLVHRGRRQHDLAEAELFGNVQGYPSPGMPERPGLVGAAHGGTLFLDELCELPEGSQSTLLRVLHGGRLCGWQ